QWRHISVRCCRITTQTSGSLPASSPAICRPTRRCLSSVIFWIRSPNRTFAPRQWTCWLRSAALLRCLRSKGAPRVFERSRFYRSRWGLQSIGSARRRHVLDRVSLTADEFRRLCEFLYRRTGMMFTEAKRYYVERRAQERMLATEAGSFEDYFALLRVDRQ